MSINRRSFLKAAGAAMACGGAMAPRCDCDEIDLHAPMRITMSSTSRTTCTGCWSVEIIDVDGVIERYGIDLARTIYGPIWRESFPPHKHYAFKDLMHE